LGRDEDPNVKIHRDISYRHDVEGAGGKEHDIYEKQSGGSMRGSGENKPIVITSHHGNDWKDRTEDPPTIQQRRGEAGNQNNLIIHIKKAHKQISAGKELCKLRKKPDSQTPLTAGVLRITQSTFCVGTASRHQVSNFPRKPTIIKPPQKIASDKRGRWPREFRPSLFRESPGEGGSER